VDTPPPSLEDFTSLLGVLASDPSPDAVIRVLVQGFLAPLKVERASLHLVSEDGILLRIVGSFGYPARSTDRFVAIDTAVDLPVTRVLRGGCPLTFRPESLPEEFPLLRSESPTADIADLGGPGTEWVFLPIQLDGRPSGVFAFLGRADAMHEHRNLIATQGLSSALALWLYRARDSWSRDGVMPGLGGVTPLALSDRQREILLRVAEDMSNSEIADLLGCSRSTVKQELQRMMFQLAVSDRSQAAARARELGLLDPGPTLAGE
jgi:DNA-binding CsgD family transcriptional regulator